MSLPETDAHKVFQSNLERSRAFLRIFDQDRAGGRGRGRPTDDEKELLRGSLVFAVGALDAYLSDLVLEIVPEHAPRSQHLTDALRSIAKNDPALALRVALAGSGAKQEFRDALDDWLSTKTFHGPEKVVQALGYVGCAIPWEDFNSKTGLDTAAELQRITDERHDIVHRGRKPYIVRESAGSANDLISGIADLVDRRVRDTY